MRRPLALALLLLLCAAPAQAGPFRLAARVVTHPLRAARALLHPRRNLGHSYQRVAPASCQAR